jgi:hypothetical protein
LLFSHNLNPESSPANGESGVNNLPGLVPVGEILDSISITKLRLKQLDTIQLVRDQRANGKQELAYHARPFVLCGTSLAPPAGRDQVGSSSSERQVLSGYRRSSAFWFADGQSRLHLFTLAFGMGRDLHPFHPLRGRRFEVLKKRRVAGVDTLILRELERGTLSIPREWTDWADPSPHDSLTLPPHRLAADSLFELVALLDALPASAPPAPERTLKKRIDK